MKKTIFLITVLTALLATCVTSPTPDASSTQEASGDIVMSFDGLWELPNGQFQLFEKNIFVLMDDKRILIEAGIFSYTDTQFVLNLEKDHFVSFNHVFESTGMKVSGGDSKWESGIWKKINNENNRGNPLSGYWENISEGEIRIMYILPFGWGTWFTCDFNYNLIEKFQIRYEDSNHTEFRYVVRRDGYPISFPVNYKFDGPDLIVGEGSRYLRR